MKIVLASALVLGLWGATASADLFVEIVGDGEAPDAIEGHFPFFYEGYFDVYVWGDAPDTQLYVLDFDVAWVFGEDVQLLELGTVDPGGLFDGPNSAGVLAGQSIDGIRVFDFAGVPLPQSMEAAYLLYDNFRMYFDAALVRPLVNAVLTDAGSAPVVHTIGVWSTPEPTTIAALAAGLVWVRRR